MAANASNMILLDASDQDPLLREYAARFESKRASGWDRANAALLRAEQAGAILSEEEIDPSEEIKRVATLAALAAELHAHGADAECDLAGDAAEQAALRVDAFDEARFDGLARPQAFEERALGANRR